MFGPYQLAADALFKIGAIKFGDFKLKLHEENPDAPMSPIYIDLRILRSYPEERRIIVNLLKNSISGLMPDLVADIPLSVSPLVAILADDLGLPMVTPRFNKKDWGTQASILGDFKTGKTVTIIDDLVTKAFSALEAIAILERGGLIIKNILVLIDREQGGSILLKNKGYHLLSIFVLKDLLKYYLDNGDIDRKRYDQVINYLAD